MNISPITLGTAQLTQPYGISNSTIDYNKDSAFFLLDSAIENGLTTWDTSPVYGNSEKIIGQYIKMNQSSVTICTKLPSIITKYGYKVEKNKIYDIVTNNIELSLKSLNKNVIDCYLIHDERDFITYGEILIDALNENINKEKILTIGISLYTPKIANLAFLQEEIKLIQLPINIFDQRFNELIMSPAAKNNKIIVRSVFLQGLFFLSANIYRIKVPSAYNYIKRLSEFSIENNLSINEIAIRYILSIGGFTSMVLGMENSDQLLTNLSYIKKSKLSDELYKELIILFKDVPTEVINPNNWGN